MVVNLVGTVVDLHGVEAVARPFDVEFGVSDDPVLVEQVQKPFRPNVDMEVVPVE